MAVQSIADQYYNKEIDAWKCDPVLNAAIAAAHPRPVFSFVAPEVMDAPNEDTTHWRMWEHVVSRFLNNNQSPKEKVRRKSFVQVRGTCGGQGNAGALDMMTAIFCFRYGMPFPGFNSPAAQYAIARVELGNMAGRWDGVIGAYCSQVPKKRGVLYLDQTLGNRNITMDNFQKSVYADEQLAVQWAASRSGLPDDMEPTMSQCMIEDVIPCQSYMEAAKAIQNGNMVVGGSTLIPTGQRDRFGYSPLRNAGGHWTFLGDVRWSGSVPSFLYYQSWEGWGSGGVYPTDQPEGTVWITHDECQALLNGRDYYIFVRPKGLTYEPRMRNTLILGA